MVNTVFCPMFRRLTNGSPGLAAKGPAAPSSAQHLPKSSSPKVSPSAQNNEFRFFGQRLDPRIDPVGAIIFKTVSEASAKRQHARKTASDLHSHSTSISTQEKNEAQPPVRIARQTFPRFSKTPLSAKVGGKITNKQPRSITSSLLCPHRRQW
jgi:hypothetical protein